MQSPGLHGYQEVKGRVLDIDDEQKPTAAKNAHSMIQKLLGYQRANGSFAISDHNVMKEVLGPLFLKPVARLEIELGSLIHAVTVAVIAILEQQYQPFHNLWFLMVKKAKEFLLAYRLGNVIEELITQVKGNMMSNAVAMNEERKTSFIELEVAPTA
ncbi:hypothetical protein HJFPF1_08797 [Paramyrothecium foliicola]|nr:hypothetical protein HJFPF1_08797 [Paramyrothecium foliicola]